MRALAAGQLTEDRAVFVAEGVEVLSVEARAVVDEDLAGHPQRLESLGDRGVQEAVRTAVEAIDDGAAVARMRMAEQGRRVTIRRLPDAMAQLTAILPVAQAAAVAGALRAASASARAAGDGRTAGQVAADTLVERVTGQDSADGVPLRVGLVMTDSSIDHVLPVASGGTTSVENGQGLCEACNYAKESSGWEHSVVGSEGPDRTDGDIATLTPTGHQYFSPPPKLPGAVRRAC
jgi:hypothetical protein